MKPETLHIFNLSVGYQRFPIMENISANLPTGKLVGLIGKNGTGKSTLLKTLCGLIPPISGEIILSNQKINTFSAESLAKKISIGLTNKPDTLHLTVRELMEFGRYPYANWMGKIQARDEEKIQQSIELLQIQSFVSKPLGQLSDGQLQKAMIARNLAQDTPFILLDEPTSHLDLTNKYELMALLKHIAHTTNKGILIATHELRIATQHCDEFWCMQPKIPLQIGNPNTLITNKTVHKCLGLNEDIIL